MNKDNMNIKPATEENIRKAAKLLIEGSIVSFPTETVYGLGANGLDAISVARIYEIKNRPTFNPLILHISELSQLDEIALVDDSITQKLIEEFWPGPLTLILEKKDLVPDIVTAGNSTVAVRMPDHRVAQLLLKYASVPIAAPSANKFGCLSPTTAEHVYNQLGNSVDMILDGGKCEVGLESTIIRSIGSKFELLRPGGIDVEQIELVTGKLERPKIIGNNPIAPGMLPFHYAPSKPLRIISDFDQLKLDTSKSAAIFFQKINPNISFKVSRVLSSSGDIKEAAANLFGVLHDLEKSDVEIIFVESIEERGIGAAIMNRLLKAQKKFG